MAIIKRRIMTRSRLLTLMFKDTDQIAEKHDYGSIHNIQSDLSAYLLADGKEVKIFHDVNMGGMVVEYDDGE